MPNRIIKESICSSEKLNQLSDFEFRLWVGLITYVDDAGRGDARPAIIKGRIFPLRDRITNKDVENALSHLAAIGCVSLYEVDGKPYLWFPTWKVHQRVRDCKPKYPEPPDCGELPQVAADCGSRARESNPIQSESESESNPNTSRASAFDAFWSAYPKKVGKGAAEKSFSKLSTALLPQMLSAIDAQKQSDQWKKDGGQFIPNPATWLNQRRWEDELPVEGETEKRHSAFQELEFENYNDPVTGELKARIKGNA